MITSSNGEAAHHLAQKDLIRILVVEDSEDHGELLMRQLRKAGLDGHVKMISDGRKAWDFILHKCECEKLVAIFLDLTLPSLGGISLLRKIRNHEDLHSVPVIVVSSSESSSEWEECERLRVTAIVSKPVNFASFSKAVADVFHSGTPFLAHRSE